METVSDMIAGFLVGLTPGTRTQYRSVVSRWLRWCADNGIDMLRAKRTHIEVFAAYDGVMRPAAKSTVYRNLSVVCCFYRYLFEEGYIDCNPGEHVRRPKMYGHSDGTYLTREQARLFLAEARGMDTRTDALCSLLLLTGARVSEALGLDLKTVIWMTGVRGCGLTARATGLSVWPFPPRRPRLLHDLSADVGVVRCSVRIPACVCGSRPPLASYRPWHCVLACRIFRRIHCGERSARSPVTLACRTGTSWPQRGGTVRRCSTITTCPVAG